jgi:hypothetical protein
MLRRALLSLFVAVPIVLIACSDDSSSSSVTPEQGCDQFATAICEKYDQCAPLFVQLGFGTSARCVDRFKINCPAAFSANGTSTTPAKASQCAADLKNVSCEDALGRILPASCRTEPGALADGMACADNAQCKGKLCRLGQASTCGACSTIGAAGTACDRDEDCEYGLGCAVGKCVGYAKAGETCDGKATPCLGTLACAGGKCAVPLEAGVACTPAAKDGENPCNGLKGLFCHPINKVCAQVKLAAAGEACGYVDNTFVGCTSGECKGADGAKPGTCQAHAADGATCTAGAQPTCELPARCVGGVCKITDPAACK